MEHGGVASVDYYMYCHPMVIKPTSFYEYYRRPVTNDQLISRESYPPQQVPAHQRHGSPYHHSYHHHYQHHGRGDVTVYDDVTESRCVTSFTELQPAPRAPARSLVVQSIDGSTEWTSTPPSFTHSHHCKYFLLSKLNGLRSTAGQSMAWPMVRLLYLLTPVSSSTTITGDRGACSVLRALQGLKRFLKSAFSSQRRPLSTSDSAHVLHCRYDNDTGVRAKVRRHTSRRFEGDRKQYRR